MTMVALLTSLGMYLVAIAVHVVWWKVRLPRHHTGALIVVFALTPVVAAAGWLVVLSPPALAWGDLPGMVLLYLSASGCYLITYAGVEETSPSLVIIRALERSMGRGCTREELETLITEDRFVRPRLEALKRDGFIENAGSGYRLSRRGVCIAVIIASLAQLFNIDDTA